MRDFRSLRGISVLLVLLVGCQNESATAPFISKKAGEGDVTFITQIYNVIHFDIDEGNLVATHTSNQAVINIANYLSSRAVYYRGLIIPAAQRASVQPPDVLMPDLVTRLDRLRGLNGAAFDQAYIEDQIFSHEQAFNQSVEMVGVTQNPRLNKLLRESLRQLRVSLERLRALRGSPDTVTQ